MHSTILHTIYIPMFVCYRFSLVFCRVFHWFVFATVVIVVVLTIDLVAMVVGAAGGLLDFTMLKYFVLLYPNKSKSGPYTFNKSISKVSSICEKYLFHDKRDRKSKLGPFVFVLAHNRERERKRNATNAYFGINFAV